MTVNRRNSLLLIIMGLVGIGFYAIVARFTDVSIISNAIFQGVWYGTCIGLELVGVYFLSKQNS